MAHRALVADSDPTTRSQIAALLSRGGCAVETAEDGERAYSRFLASMPDLVVVDDALAKKSLVELCQQIRELSGRTRIVVLRGVPADAAERQRVRDETRCDAVLIRPLRIEALTDLLSGWELIAPPRSTDTPLTVAFGVPVPQRPVPPPAPIVPAPPVPVPIPPPEPQPISTDPKPIASEPAEPTPVAVAPPARLTPLPQTMPAPTAPLSRLTPLPRTRPAPMAPPARITPAPPPPARRTPAPVAPPARVTPTPPPPARSEPVSDPVAAVALRGAAPPAAGPSSLLPSGVSRFGDLTSMPFPRLLYELWVGTYFGVLHLERERARRTVYFWAGVPVRVDTDQLSESLGSLLREREIISAQQLDIAKEFALTRGSAIGVALVQTGALHERDLLEALTHQTERKLISTFAWRDGRYVAHDDTSFVNDTMLNDVRPLQVIWRGVHEHYEIGALLHFFSQHQARYIVASDLFEVQARALSEHLGDLSLPLNGRTTFEQALVADPARTVELARALYVLLVTDMVRASEVPGTPAPTLADAPAAAELVDYAALMAASERIAREYVRIKGADAFCVLQLDRDVDTNTVEQIYAGASRRLAIDRDLAGLPPEDQKRAREIARIYTRAFETLVDPDRREVYRRSLEAAPPTPVAEAPPVETNTRRRALFAAERAYDEGMALLTASEPGAARAKFQIAVDTHPDEATYRVAVAQAIIAGGAEEDENPHALAFALVEEALRLDPSSLPANIEAAKLAIHAGMPDAARDYLERVLQRAPDHPAAQKMLREL